MARMRSLVAGPALVAGLLLPLAAIAAQSCRQEIGVQKADVYVRQCTKVSPATHPPCNAQNPCDMILAEIYRGCRLLKPAERPSFCGPASATPPQSPPEVVPKG